MDSGRLLFSPTSTSNMLFFGNCDSVFQGARSMMNKEETNSKRGFFCSSRYELFDDEYYDEQLLEKKRRLTPQQVNLLEKSFETENKLEAEHKTQLAKKLGLQPRQVAVWFQNRRARWKTKQLERDYHQLKSTYDSLLSQYDSNIKHNDKLKAEVILLTEKLQAKALSQEAMPNPKPEPLVAECDYSPPLDQLSVKVEDRVSTGTGGSAVVDDDGPQQVDSGYPLFPSDDYHCCIGLMDTDVVHSEEDDGGSDDGGRYLSRVLVAEQQHRQEEGEPLGWWVWS